MLFVAFVLSALGLRAQQPNNETYPNKKWVLSTDAGVIFKGFNEARFFENGTRDLGGTKLLKDNGVGFHLGASYGRRFSDRYYLGANLVFNRYNSTPSSFNTLPITLVGKVNHKRSAPNTFYVQGNFGYAIPLGETFAQGRYYAYSLGYQFMADKDHKHLLNIALQNQSQNVPGFFTRYTFTQLPNGQKSNETATITKGMYRVNSWSFNVGYTF